MNKVFNIGFNFAWVKMHRNDDVSPMRVVADALQSSNCKVLKNDQLVLQISCHSSVTLKQIVELVTDIIRKNYPSVDPSAVFICTEGDSSALSDDSASNATDEGRSVFADANPGGASHGEGDKITLGEELNVFADNNSSSRVSEPPQDDSDVMNKINNLVGEDEFKELAQEIITIAPHIIRNGTLDTFMSCSYIFSINDGYGLSTCLDLFAKLLNSVGLTKFGNQFVEEVRISAPNGERMDMFETAMDCLRDRDSKLLCIDITEWMNALGSREFRLFLRFVRNYSDNKIIVFRVPFVEKEVLANIRESLNDELFVREVSFSPFTTAEIDECAKRVITGYGFSVNNDAWNGFNNRIAEEKGDGRFYGLSTIGKVVRELLYKKQLSNSKSGKDDKVITAKDTAQLSTVAPDNVTGMEMLDKLVGVDSIKQRIVEIVSQIEASRNDKSMGTPCVHMRFVGNPGTGKTTIARIVAKILKEKGVLKIGNLYEYSGRDFCGKYIGETAPKTAGMCRDAYGSVLFIDEAYSLFRGEDNTKDYGVEAIDTLIAEMENHRSELVVIMAGYPDDMERLMKGNAGLASRMPYVVEFPNYTREQLYDIFVSMVKRNFEYEEDMLDCAKQYFLNLSQEFISAKEFSNARFVRNLFERTWAKAAMRKQLNKLDKIVLTKDDFITSSTDKEFANSEKKKTKIGFYN